MLHQQSIRLLFIDRQEVLWVSDPKSGICHFLDWFRCLRFFHDDNQWYSVPLVGRLSALIQAAPRRECPMSYSYVTDESPRLSVDDVLGLIDWKELENVLSSPDDTSRAPMTVDVPMTPMYMQPEVEPLANVKTPPRRARKTSRSTPAKAQTPTTAQPSVAPQAGPPVKKKRIRREIVELKYLRSKVKELEEQLRELQLGFSTLPRAEGEPIPLDGFIPSVWTSMAGRQLKDRMRAERENQELRDMLQDQLKIAQGLEDTLKQLPPSQNVGGECGSILPPDLFGPSSSETLAESLGHLERSYLNVNEAFTMEGVDKLEMDKHEIKATHHPSYGTCIRFTTRIAMPFNYDITSRAVWRFITEEGLISLASSFNVRTETNAHPSPYYLANVDLWIRFPDRKSTQPKTSKRTVLHFDCQILTPQKTIG
ncbi:unnamed protein product [Phytophthora fragariaefolia]|uniref:Unnamed protein product n=1 Tax=Phytophthora fragariaefolia TaxID=1490495 RepID=A0A9W6XQH8_9STRA|nr:unnamed protein product [Phytophthora fragariaefolia]